MQNSFKWSKTKLNATSRGTQPYCTKKNKNKIKNKSLKINFFGSQKQAQNLQKCTAHPLSLLALIIWAKDLQLCHSVLSNTFDVSGDVELPTLPVICATGKGMHFFPEFTKKTQPTVVREGAVCIQPPDSWPASHEDLGDNFKILTRQ